MRCGIDRARRFLLESFIGITGNCSSPNRNKLFFIFNVFLAFFREGKRHFEKASSASDRASRALSWFNVDLIGASYMENPFKKYSNPDLRYSTSHMLHFHVFSLR